MDFGEILERPLESNITLIILADGVMAARNPRVGALRGIGSNPILSLLNLNIRV